MRVVEVRIEGTAPLLQHRYYAADKPEDPSTIRTGRPAWEEEGEKAAYRDREGRLCQPADHIHAAMVKAANNFKIPGRRGKSYRELFQSSIEIKPDLIIHSCQEYEIDARPVVNPATKMRVIRYRPRLDKWALDFQINIVDEQLDSRVVREVLDYAGRCLGIGDYRPKFGRFVVTKWEVEAMVRAS